MNPLLNQPPHSVLSHFAPQTRGLTWHRAPGGFSGARVFRGDDASGAPRLALKAWPQGTTTERLRQLHEWMRQTAHLPFVPEVLRGIYVAETGVWDCCLWMPGDPRLAPTSAQVVTACEAVARLHDAWASESQRGPCPGVLNRLRILTENDLLLRAGPGALPTVSPIFAPRLRRMVELVARAAPLATRALDVWARSPLTLQPCVRDLRAEHVLFVGDKVSGLIDFGAVSVDHPAVDLARLLGDYSPSGGALFDAGMAAYRAARPAFDASDDFVRLLADVGVVCSVLGWIVRLAVRRDSVSDPTAVAARLDQLLGRLSQIPRC